MPRHLQKTLLSVLASFACLYVLLWAAKGFLLDAPACSQACVFSDSFWRSGTTEATASECEPLKLEVELAQDRLDRRQLAPLWYRVKVTNSSCLQLEELNLDSILDYRLPLRLQLLDADNREIAVGTIAAVKGDRGAIPSDVYFLPDSRTGRKSSLAPGESAQSAGYHFEPLRHVPQAEIPEPQSTSIKDGWAPKPFSPGPGAPIEHRGYNALFYGRFTKPGRYSLVATVHGEAKARKRFPRFERLPLGLQRALIVAARLAPVPIPAPQPSEFEGRYVRFEARSLPAAFEVAP